jgi:hypothetical protein
VYEIGDRAGGVSYLIRSNVRGKSSPPYVEAQSWQQVAERFCKRSLEDWDVVHYHFFTAIGLATQRNEALAKPGKFTDAVWMVSVAVPGTAWNRVDCPWCRVAAESPSQG